MPQKTIKEAMALHFMRRLYEATGGRPNEWRLLAGLQLTQEAVEFAVERGWCLIRAGRNICLTDAGCARVIEELS